MYKKMRKVKISLISEFIVVTMVLGAFLLLIQEDSPNKILENVQEKNNLRQPPSLFTEEEAEKNTEIKDIVNKVLVTHGINIYYGEETRGIGNKLNAEELYNPITIYNNIKKIDKALTKYPPTLFQEFKEGKNNYSVSIYLVDKFNNDNVALSTRNTKNDFKMYFSDREDLENIMHHELFHILEYFLQLEYDSNILFGKWSTCNPSGYVYPNSTRNITREFTHEEKLIKENVYFVSRYAKTSEKEDRAETFADMMKEQTKPYYYSEEYAINKKALILKTVLELKFNSVTEETKEEWEKFLE